VWAKLTVYSLVAQHLAQDEGLIDPDQDTRLTVAINAVWDIARKATLRCNTWNFAIERVSLPALSDAPAFGYGYQFNLPGDFVRLADIDGPIPQARDWKLEGGKLLGNSTPLQVIYVRDCTEVERWDDLFELALSYKIAELIAVQITGDANVKMECQQSFKDVFGDAQATDAQENPPQGFDDDPWVTARWGYGYSTNWPS
jgi:hypothetical protein